MGCVECSESIHKVNVGLVVGTLVQISRCIKCIKFILANLKEKLVSLLCPWVLIDHSLPRLHITPGAPARKEVFANSH